MRNLIIGLASIGLVSGAAYSDDSMADSADARPAEAIDFMLGQWSGEGWMLAPNGYRAEFRVEESVVAGANGHAVIIHGTGYAGEDDRVVHDALGLVWQEGDGSYRMRSVVMQGFTLEVTPVITETALTWEFDAGPMGRTRYVSEFSTGQWVETGSRLGPDGEWTVFLRMDLDRVD